MKPPCDEGVVRSPHVAVPRAAQAQRWILAATIFGSSMAFIDGTVVNVALPALQASLHASVVDVQWVVPGGFDSCRRLAWRFVWPPIDFPDWSGDFCRRFRRVRACFEYSAAGDRAQRPRHWSRFSGPGQPVAYQRLVR